MKMASFRLHKWRINEKHYPLSDCVYAIIDARGLLEVEESVHSEAHILIFQTFAEAEGHIIKMNEDFWIHPNGEKVFWYKNRNNKPIKINPNQRRWKSKYTTLEKAISLAMGIL